MQKPFRFTDEFEATWAELQLVDLCRVLSRNGALDVAFEPVSRVRMQQGAIAISTNYGEFDPVERFHCQLADVYLRCLGTQYDHALPAMSTVHSALAAFTLPNLALHVFCAIDDGRLAERIRRERRGTRQAFAARTAFYARMLQSNRASRLRKQLYSDVWFADWYGQIADEHSDVYVKASACADVLDVLRLTDEFMRALPPDAASWPDLTFHLFGLDDGKQRVEPTRETGQTERADRTWTQPSQTADGEADGSNESVDVWTQQQDSNRAWSLEMSLDDKAPSEASRRGGRLAESSPAQVQVRRARTKDGPRESVAEVADDRFIAIHEPQPLRHGGSEGRVMEVYPVDRDGDGNDADLDAWEQATFVTRRRLVRVFSSMMERSKIAGSTPTRHGRPGKRLERLATDRTARLFYRKTNPGAHFDTVAHILVDCSGSMQEYLETCKPVLYLFHETLRRLNIVHGVTGFWEDTEYQGVMHGEPITYLSHVIPYHRSLSADCAANIANLEPQLDNRDGLAIRRIAQTLLARPERQKWLLVLSDAQPAAEDYQNAIEDTKRAVQWARRRQIHVVHVSIAEADDGAAVAMVKQLYGDDTVVVTDHKDLPATFERVMRDMLRRAVDR
ncbi:cobaltochelatase CobT-related protein [Alicyclobacillus acidiphilus]|uniref:cobaltochelatase CobT-related protein n=1 Tax=Alicyclobacillus acidiphilus TaxID=182455 RepID=UPI000831D6B1|nr:hypothetical protein [Alicyclobacillus acidiphilus]